MADEIEGWSTFRHEFSRQQIMQGIWCAAAENDLAMITSLATFLATVDKPASEAILAGLHAVRAYAYLTVINGGPMSTRQALTDEIRKVLAEHG